LNDNLLSEKKKLEAQGSKTPRSNLFVLEARALHKVWPPNKVFLPKEKKYKQLK
jgi:hypothetical protein